MIKSLFLHMAIFLVIYFDIVVKKNNNIGQQDLTFFLSEA